MRYVLSLPNTQSYCSSLTVKPNKLLLLILLFPLLISCQSEETHLFATKKWRISEGLIVDGKLSENGEFTSLLLANNSLELWNNRVQQKVSAWQSDQLVPNTILMDLSDSAEFILSANDNSIQVWHTESKEPLGMVDFSTHLGDAKITQVQFWISPNRFLIGTSGGDVIFADSLNNAYRVNRQHNSDVVKLELSKDKQSLFSGGNDGLVVKWDVANYRPLTTKTLPFRIVSLAVGGDSQVFISDALKEHVLWDSSQDSVIGRIKHWKRFQWFRHAIVASEQPWIITSSPKTYMYLWSSIDMKMLGSWEVEAQSLGSSVEDMKLMGQETLRTLSTDAVLQDWDLSSFVSNPEKDLD